MITITIPKNDYVKPSEPRQEVVQRMVDILIKEVNRGFVGEFCANNCWRRTFGIGRHKETKRDEFLTDCVMYVNSFYEDIVRPTTCEMKLLFKIWTKAGYYIGKGSYSVRHHTAILYRFSKKPYTDYGYRTVTEFTEDIDY